MTGWAELRMTKIEPKELSIRSSNLDMQMVNASGPTSLLKSKPPQEDDIDEIKDNENDSITSDQQLPFEKVPEDEPHSPSNDANLEQL